ncbi:hypothetical protein B0H19DRAFT_1235138 [Mycena capillaripes]|nr:hypothetical protein B0H19DRAFT_1235138 [Mycena capillaripes]
MSGSGAQELRARIEKLNTEIDLQKEVLKNLEREKSFTQRQLNTVLDPMTRLPLEISSEIFLQSLPAFPEHGTVQLAMLFLNVCNSWTDIALSTPALWANINIVFPCTEGFKKVLPIWLQRAGNRPLSILLRGPGAFDRCVVRIIWQHGQQLKHLEICYDNEEDEDEDSDEDAESEDKIEFFGGISPGSMPLLETLTIRGLTDLNYWQGYSKLEFLELLRLAPNLVECRFSSVLLMYNNESEPDEILVLPALRRLVFGEYELGSDSNDDILNCISLPGLEALSVSLWAITTDDLFSFLERSLPPLRELVLGRGDPHLDFIQLAECLRLVPTLTRFEIWELEFTTLHELFVALAESSSPIIPNLRNLSLQQCSPDIPHSSWKTLLRALARWRTKLQTIHINMKAGAVKPTPDILAAFAELVADGIQVYIGTTETNFLSG